MTNYKQRIYIDRCPCDQRELDRKCDYREPTDAQCGGAIKTALKKCCRCTPSGWKRALFSFFPFLTELRSYRPRFIPYDILAGVSVGIVQIPQSMAIALLASVPPVYGLYTSFWPVLFYFFFGTSRHLSLGTMAIISLIISGAVNRELQLILKNNPTQALAFNDSLITDASPSINTVGLHTGPLKASIATTMTLLIGIMQLAMGFLRLGIVTTFMPVSFISGFTTATAIYVLTSQSVHLFGITPGSYVGVFRLPYTWKDIALILPSSNLATMVISLCCLIVLIILKEIIAERYKERIKIPIPAELFVVIITTAASYLADFKNRWEVKVVGRIPVGIPQPVAPPMQYAPNLIVDSFMGAVLSFVVSISLANVFTRKYKYVVDSNQELIAYGIMHTASSFFHCIAGAAAPPRCFVYETCGGKTSVAHLFSCVLLLVVLLAIGPMFQYLPNAVLGCIIIVAIFPLFKQFRDLKTFWHLNKMDGIIWSVTFIATVFLDMGIGLGIGIGFSILSIVIQPLLTRGYLLSDTSDADVYVPDQPSQSLRQSHPIRVFHFDNTLYFASVQRFRQQLYCAVFDPQCKQRSSTDLTDNEKEHRISDIRVVVLDCAAFDYIDIAGFNILTDVHSQYANVDVDIVLANCGEAARESLQRGGLLQPEGPFVLFPTIQDAVNYMGLFVVVSNPENVADTDHVSYL